MNHVFMALFFVPTIRSGLYRVPTDFAFRSIASTNLLHQLLGFLVVFSVFNDASERKRVIQCERWMLLRAHQLISFSHFSYVFGFCIKEGDVVTGFCLAHDLFSERTACVGC